MHRTAFATVSAVVLVAGLLIVSGAARGEDPAAPAATRPVGTLLLDSLPAQADLVVDAPDLPALFQSVTKAGLGDAAAWRAAFDAQLRAWGAGTPDPSKLVTGAGDLLAAADGEVVLASMAINLPGTAAPNVRATLFAMRTTRDEKTLRAAFKGLVEGGLRLRYEGIARTEEIGARPVIALPGSTSTLYVLVQDGLMVACDHPLALGIFFRGLAREQPAAAPAARPPVSQLRLIVRYGRGDAAWEGWMWGESESVSWKESSVRSTHLTRVDALKPRMVFVIGADKVEDLPLFPVPVPRAPDAPPGTTYVGFDGSVFAGAGPGDASCVPGGAWRLGWMRAFADGRTETPFPGMDAELLGRPYDSATKAAGDKAGEFIAWKSPEAGHLSGPLGHGPATFLALRCLHDIARGISPGDAPPAARPPARKREDAPLPAPTEPKDK